MDVLSPLLPRKYAPLRANGAGLQNLYLTPISPVFAAALVDIAGSEARDLVSGQHLQEELAPPPGVGLVEWEEHEVQIVQCNHAIPETTRTALILARRGQGLFKRQVMSIERACRISGVNRVEHLRASHCKPWRDASNEERLDGENGLLLVPNADHLFDRGFISFDNNGDVLVSPVAHAESLTRLGIDPRVPLNVGGFTEGQRRYLEFHRENVLLQSRFLLE